MTVVAPISAVVLAQAVVISSWVCTAVLMMRLRSSCPTFLLLLLLLALG